MSDQPYRNVYQFIWFYLNKIKYMFFFLLLFFTLGEICRQTGLYYASRIAGVMTETAPKDEQIRGALYYIALMGLFMVLRALIDNSKSLFAARCFPRLRLLMTRDLFSQAHKHAVQFFAEEMSGRVAAKINQIINEVFEAESSFEPIFGGVVRLLIGFYFLVRINVLIGISLIILTILYLVFLYYNARQIKVVSGEAHNQYSVANGFLTDTLFNYAVIKNDGRNHHERYSLVKYIIPWLHAERKIYQVELKIYMVQDIIRGVLWGIFMCIPLYLWLQNKINVADFVLVESLITYLTMFAMNIMNNASRFFRSLGGIEDGINFLFQPIQVVDQPGARPIEITKGNIVFEKVDFAYHLNQSDKSLLFQQFDLQIHAGEKVGLVGASGAGKSSLIKLISRYYDIDGGQILIDGQNIAVVKQESLRQQIAVIEQNPALFNRTIMDNIRYGRLTATDEEIIEAAKKAYIHDFIMRLPKGYQTMVGERGIILSGGERQRIAIARAILKNAPILILDEATSALDSESELFIQKSLRQIMKHKTVVAIAHRLSTLREMDYLLVLENGRIIEKGTHKALLRQNGVYAAFYKRQIKGFQEAA